MDGLYEPNNWGVMEVTRFKRASGALADKMVGYRQEQHRPVAALAERPARRQALVQWRQLRLGRHRLRAVHQPFGCLRLHAAGGIRAGRLADTRQPAAERGASDRADAPGYRQAARHRSPARRRQDQAPIPRSSARVDDRAAVGCRWFRKASRKARSGSAACRDCRLASPAFRVLHWLCLRVLPTTRYRTRSRAKTRRRRTEMQSTMMSFPLNLSHFLERASCCSRPGNRLAQARQIAAPLHLRRFPPPRSAARRGAAAAGHEARRPRRHAHVEPLGALETYFGGSPAGGVLHTLNLRLHPTRSATSPTMPTTGS